MAMENEPGEQFARPEIDPRTGIVEKVDPAKRAKEASTEPDKWRDK